MKSKVSSATKRCKMKKILLLVCVSTFVFAYTDLKSVLVNTGRSIQTQAGFYDACGRKGLVNVKKPSFLWAIFSSNKYITQTMSSSELLTFDKRKFLKNSDIWIDKGASGYLVKSPEKSDETMKVEFTKENCQKIKNFLDAKFSIMYNSVFAK